jgi:hypothetical protein
MICAGRAGIQEVPGFPVKTEDFGDTDRRLFDAGRISILNERVDISQIHVDTLILFTKKTHDLSAPDGPEIGDDVLLFERCADPDGQVFTLVGTDKHPEPGHSSGLR